MREFPPFRLDAVNQCMWRRKDSGDEERILLKPKEFAILLYLVDHAGRLVTQDELLEAVWPDTFVQPEVLKRHIFGIRDVLGDDPKNPSFIETLTRRGYQFIAAIRDPASAEPTSADIPAQTKLVGRDRALGELRAYLQRASRGQRQIVFVTGEPGIGKTTLVDEFQRQAAAGTPISIARGQCVEGYGGKEAYYPMLEALGNLCRGPAGDSVVQILAAQAPTWLVQFPSLISRRQREILQREILGATSQRMLREIEDALETITSERPLLLVLEDLHWVDHSTVDLISALARGRGPAKLLLIGTYRPVDVALSENPFKVVKQDLLVHQLCHELALEPLGETEIAAYLVGESPVASVPEGLAALLHRHSEGNPLFMVAALEHMTERGFISRESGTWKLNVPLVDMDVEAPEGLRQMIEIQIDRLSAKEQRVLEVASLESVGRSWFVVAARAAAGDLEPEAFEDVCETLSRRHCILRSGRSEKLKDGTVSPCYEFVHALYREVCYRRIVPGRRAKLHMRIGQWAEAHTEQLNEAAPWLAEHFEQGGDWPRAVKYLRLAADTARRRFEPRQAAEILEHALELVNKLPDAERAVAETGILEKLAAIYFTSGDIRAVETYATLSRRAAHFGLIDVAVHALVASAFILSNGSLERGLEVLERASDLVATLDPAKHRPTHATCLFCRLWLSGWNPQQAEEYRNAIREIRKSESRDVVGPQLVNYSCIQWCSSEYRESHQNAVEGRESLLTADDANPFLSSFGYLLGELVLLMNLIFLGEWGECARGIEDAIARANKSGDYYFQGRGLQLCCRAWLHLHACDFAGVLTICDSAVPLVRDPTPRFAPDDPSRSPFHLQLSLVFRGSAEVALGRYERAREYLFAARDDMDRQRTTFHWYTCMLLESGLTELWLAERNLTQARTQAERFLSVALTTAERTWQALAWEANARVALAELDIPRAQDCIAKALSTMEGYELPLAAWHVYATASELYRKSGDRDLAERHRALSRETIMKLANSLRAEEPLRKEFLSAPAVVRILGEGKAQSSERALPAAL